MQIQPNPILLQLLPTKKVQNIYIHMVHRSLTYKTCTAANSIGMMTNWSYPITWSILTIIYPYQSKMAKTVLLVKSPNYHLKQDFFI